MTAMTRWRFVDRAGHVLEVRAPTEGLAWARLRAHDPARDIVAGPEPQPEPRAERLSLGELLATERLR
jgi:hypothetical protein